MTAAWAVLCGLLGLVILVLRGAVNGMSRGEAQTRLSQLPQALLWLAVRQLPEEWRDDLGGEWQSELAAIRRETTETPLTGLAKELLFAAVLAIRARATARAYAGSPSALATVREAMRRLAVGFVFSAVRTWLGRAATGLSVAEVSVRGAATLQVTAAVATVFVGAASLTQVVLDRASPQGNASLSLQLAQEVRAVEGLNLGSTLVDMKAATVTAGNDLSAEMYDARIGPGDPAGACANLQASVDYDVKTIIGRDTQNVAYDVSNLQNGISTIRQDITNLQTDATAIANEGAAIPPSINALIASANSQILLAMATANAQIDQANSLTLSAYNMADALAAGQCSGDGPGSAPGSIGNVS